MAESVKSAERALRVIELLTQRGAMEFPAICEHLSLPKSSAHAILTTLRERGFLQLDEPTRRFHLGPRVWEAGQAYIENLDIAMVADPFMHRVRDELGETVQLSILDGVENVYVGKLETDHPLQLVSRLGSRLPAHTTGLGKALLAGLPDAAVLDRVGTGPLQRFTPQTIVDPRKLLTELAQIRRRGYATDKGEYTPGVFCVAAAIEGPAGTIAAMSVSIPDARCTAALRRRATKVIVAETQALSDQLRPRRAASS